MRKYEVIEQCYVPVGPGFKYKKPGQVVTLTSEQAAKLKGLVVRAGVASSVRKPDTKQETPEVEAPVTETPTEEVAPDGGEPAPADERAGDEAVG